MDVAKAAGSSRDEIPRYGTQRQALNVEAWLLNSTYVGGGSTTCNAYTTVVPRFMTNT
jgi:hypothetical protein